MIVSPECNVVYVARDSICTDYETEPLMRKIREVHGANILLPDNGVFKVEFQACTILNARYEPMQNTIPKNGNRIKLKFVPCLRKLPSGETRCDTSVFDILCLDQ